jgi:hypothetical protein
MFQLRSQVDRRILSHCQAFANDQCFPLDQLAGFKCLAQKATVVPSAVGCGHVFFAAHIERLNPRIDRGQFRNAVFSAEPDIELLQEQAFVEKFCPGASTTPSEEAQTLDSEQLEFYNTMLEPHYAGLSMIGDGYKLIICGTICIGAVAWYFR